MVGKLVSWIFFAFMLILLAFALRDGCAPNERPWVDVAPSGQSPPTTTAEIPEPSTSFSAGASAFVVQVLGHALLTGMFLSAAALAVYHRRRARAERAFDPRAPLRDGAAVIFGEVECLPGHEGPVVEIRIEQHGTEQSSKGNTSHVWKETDREVRATPFIVRCHDGTRVRVEPNDQVVLEDGLAIVVGADRTSRARRASLVAGAQIHVTGELRGASKPSGREDVYRGSSGGPVLSPPRLQRMVISTEAPGANEERRTRFHTNWAIALVIIFAVVAGALMPAYELLAFDGKMVMAEVTGKRTWQEWVKPKNQPSRLVTFYSVRARIPDGNGSFLTIDDDCNGVIYRCVDRGQCTHLPFVVATHASDIHQLGARPTLGIGRCVTLLVLMLILSCAYPMTTVGTRPWYMKKKLVETGSGALGSPQT